ncbi:rRNA maturation RNase YbeY [Pantoea sp. Mhis]|uniref:rRNA maturation RNase YbeY n=1 Tax=Pantoea sp. Mhis TaxID=2576759 RepID=UPI00135B23FD|nr:rRNA maturation RNase YbeY [Pantoea sp. Mhis]MXP56274.1 rRNA maturation RNase YbeY [Pantoea sp. Mhis]
MNKVILDLQLACTNTRYLPKKHDFQYWLEATILPLSSMGEITIRIVDKKESQQLNLYYRGYNKPTNVLSFCFEVPTAIKLLLLGDLVICSQLIESEAIKQKKDILSHWAHIVIHGTLHLLGYEHSTMNTAKKMESLETKIMLNLGFKDPYCHLS